MGHLNCGEGTASPPDSEAAKDRALQKYLNEFILPVCRETSDDGLLFLVLTGQAEEWDLQAGLLPWAAEHAALCRMAVTVLEARMRSKLAAMEPHLARLDRPSIGGRQ